jgi:CYTH domain-containing protein
MPLEIERKYLLSGMPQLPASGVSTLEIEQGWLPGTHLRERIRRAQTASGVRFYRTVKFGRGVSRVEIEEETSRGVFDVLWSLTEGRRIRKTRYQVEGELRWEIDRFADHDLVLAEVELPSEDTRIEFPDWLVPVMVREVTEEPDYVNYNLAG